MTRTLADTQYGEYWNLIKTPSPLLYHIGFIIGLAEGDLPSLLFWSEMPSHVFEGSGNNDMVICFFRTLPCSSVLVAAYFGSMTSLMLGKLLNWTEPCPWCRDFLCELYPKYAKLHAKSYSTDGNIGVALVLAALLVNWGADACTRSVPELFTTQLSDIFLQLQEKYTFNLLQFYSFLNYLFLLLSFVSSS
jgi:hypothetical protein